MESGHRDVLFQAGETGNRMVVPSTSRMTIRVNLMAGDIPEAPPRRGLSCLWECRRSGDDAASGVVVALPFRRQGKAVQFFFQPGLPAGNARGDTDMSSCYYGSPARLALVPGHVEGPADLRVGQKKFLAGLVVPPSACVRAFSATGEPLSERVTPPPHKAG